MTADRYERLRELLDKHPSGCPSSPEIIKILRTYFTEDEAEVALGLGFRPFSVADIARRAEVEPGVARVHLESMADKGLVFSREKNGEWGYALLPVMPGIFEFPYMKGVHDETIEKVTPLWKKYFPKLGMEFGSESTSFSRIVPIQEEIDSNPGTLPYERVYDMIDEAKVVGIANCACREAAQNCDAPREACMLFDQTCTYLVERGFGRYLTKEEMKQKLREFDELGLVHQINNAREGLIFVCNCCSCCCGLLNSYTRFGNRNVLTPSAFRPVVDQQTCDGCGTCAEERCPMGAIEIVKDTVVFDEALCIGCGLCATGCPSDAIVMERRAEVPEPPENMREMGLRVLEDKGKLDGFLETMEP